MTLRNDITIRLEAAVAEAQKQGVLPEGELPHAIVERPQNADHGDFASSLPLRLAKAARKNPMAIAESLVPFVEIDGMIDSAWAAPPGFVNFKLGATWLQSQVEAIISAADTFGNTDTGAGKSVQVEYVSVNGAHAVAGVQQCTKCHDPHFGTGVLLKPGVAVAKTD